MHIFLEGSKYMSDRPILPSSLSRHLRLSLLRAGGELQDMDDQEDPTSGRCPCCGSQLTSPRDGSAMWECRYHLCNAIFPVGTFWDPAQMPIVAEEEPLYRPAGRKEEGKEGGSVSRVAGTSDNVREMTTRQRTDVPE